MALSFDYKLILKKAFYEAIPIMSGIQASIVAGETTYFDGQKRRPIVEIKDDCSPVTIADLIGQETIVKSILADIGDHRTYVIGEEDGITNRYDECSSHITHRLIIDPLDGTGNFVEGLNSNMQDMEGGMGWGSMIAIQEKRDDCSGWRTVAAGIYESGGLVANTVQHGAIPGRIYIAVSDLQDILVVESDVERPLRIHFPVPNKHIVGGFVHKATSKLMSAFMAQSHSQERKLRCVAQSALAVICGQAQAYFQENPNLHDAASVMYMAQKAGVHVSSVPSFPGADGKSRYPIIMARDSGIQSCLEGIYMRARGLEKG